MKYLEESFSTLPPAGQAYRDNHDRIFGKKDEAMCRKCDELHTDASTCDGDERDLAAKSPGSCDQPSEGADVHDVEAYLLELQEEVRAIADECYGDGPGKMRDCARWQQAESVLSVLANLRAFINTRAKIPLCFGGPPLGVSFKNVLLIAR